MANKGLDEKGLGRREVLECMLWAGTGVLWTVSGGIPHSVGLIGEAAAAEPTGFTFLQMSDSHIGFDKAANPDTLGTLREAVGKVKAMPAKPSFIIHTGDITHLSKPAEFDNADKIFGETGVPIHWVPGEHDIIDEERGKAYLERYGAPEFPLDGRCVPIPVEARESQRIVCLGQRVVQSDSTLRRRNGPRVGILGRHQSIFAQQVVAVGEANVCKRVVRVQHNGLCEVIDRQL